MILLYAFVFIFGLVVGSFLNAWIWRLQAGKSVLRGRSLCPNCEHILAWYDLIPVVSFVLLRGRCRYCKKPISLQYPLVEVATASLFLLAVLFPPFFFLNVLYIRTAFQVVAAILGYAYIFSIISLFIVIFVTDLRRYIIPDIALAPALVLTIAWYVFGWLVLDIYSFGAIAESFLAALGALAFFLAIFVVSRGMWLGFGDVKFSFLMGLFLGFPNILAGLFVAFWSGAIIGIILVFLKRKHIKSKVPFGPFLIFGTLAALFWGAELVQWYLKAFSLQ